MPRFNLIRNAYRKAAALVRPDTERQQLDYLLASADAKASLGDRVRWLEDLLRWVAAASSNRHDFDPATGQLHNTRLRFVLHVLERNGQWKEQVGALLRSIVLETSPLDLFTQVGLGQQRGFIAEAADRLMRSFLPREPRDRDLGELFERVFRDESDSIWVSHLAPALIRQWLLLIEPANEPLWLFGSWLKELEASVLILGARIGALGTLPEIRERLSYGTDAQDIAFLRLSGQLTELVRERHAGRLDPERVERLRRECAACHGEVRNVYAAMERAGVSVGLVYTLESLSRAIRRVDLLARFLDPRLERPESAVVDLLSALVEGRVSQRTLLGLVKANLTLIARKIVERAGRSGEHYVARTRSEYFAMLRAGLGGGAFTVLTTVVKYTLIAIHPALFFEGFFFSLNYGASFVLMQLMGFTLATKQPSATASALAGKLVHVEEEGEIREFVDEACRMTRAQFVSLIGNVVGVLPLCMALDLVTFAVTHHHILSRHTATHSLQSLQPLSTMTVPMAALTGVWLWLSSIAAGWFENWLVFRRVPEALATQRRLVQVFGTSGARRIGDWWLRNATVLGGGISLGFLMGFTAVAGKFLGLPLDIRHVTLSSGSLGLAICALYPHLTWQPVVGAIAGIALIGLFNFSVSYSLSLAVAARAREVKWSVVRRLLRAMRARLRNRPSDFFLPPRAPSAPLTEPVHRLPALAPELPDGGHR